MKCACHTEQRVAHHHRHRHGCYVICKASAMVVTVTLAEDVRHGERAQVRYTKPAENPLQDKAGNAARSFHRGVRNITPDNSSDQVPPTFASAEVSETTLKVTFNENLTSNRTGRATRPACWRRAARSACL